MIKTLHSITWKGSAPLINAWNFYVSVSLIQVFLSSEALLQHRPLPEVPSSSDEIAMGSLGLMHSLESSSLRWTSRENLLIAAQDEEGDPQLFVALYDFQAGGENQLSLKKGEQVRALNLNSAGLFTYPKDIPDFVTSVPERNFSRPQAKYVRLTA